MKFKTEKEFINAISRGEKVCLRALHDKSSKEYPIKMEAEQCNLDAVLEKAHNHNEKGYGIFLTINSGGHRNADINRVNAQFVECDDLSFDEQMKQIEAFPLEPSIIVKTRRSLHVYWLMRDAKVEQFTPIQKKLVKQFHGDPACVNESRVMRIPGFYHNKQEPIMVEMISFHPERIYTQDQLLEVLPKEATPVDNKKPSVRKNKFAERNGRIENLFQNCWFMPHCVKEAKTLSEPLWYAMITNLAVFEDGGDYIHELSRPYPNYTKEETDKKIEDFLKSGHLPYSCESLAELGFRCQELGNCPVKCPAGWGYINEKAKAEPDKATEMEQVSETDEVPQNALAEYDISDKPWYYIDNKKLKLSQGILSSWLRDNINAFFLNGLFYHYENGVYREHDRNYAKGIIRSYLIEKCATKRDIDDTLSQWEIIATKTNDDVNTNPMIINLKNGLYDVEHNQLLSHTPDYLSTIQLNIEYNPDADCPKFKKFLKDLFREEYHPFVQEMLGYMLVPITKAQKAFIVYGHAAAGKSLFLKVIEDILIGRHHVSHIPWQKLGARFMTAELYNKLANIFADLPGSSIEDTGMFKALTGEDSITAEYKFGSPFSFDSKAKLIFSCNQIPANYKDRTNGFYRRLCILECNLPLPEDQRNPELLSELKEEGSGIFNYALEGLMRLMNRNWHFDEPQLMRDSLDQYKAQNNSVLMFIRECCELGEDASVTSQELYDAYLNFCEDENMKAFARTRFTTELKDACPNITQEREGKARLRVWLGICLTDNN